jgi:GNAT superfamily N-acetyltransferase
MLVWVNGRCVSLRLAREADLPRLREVIDAAYGMYLARMDRPPAPMVHDLRPSVEEHQVWVIGQPFVAMICLIVTGEALLIENVAVHPDAQGSGLGRLLMEFAEREARRRGLGRLCLYTNEVMTENLAIYAHLGYREVGRRPEGGYRRVFMDKVLADGGPAQERPPSP